jgi:hypothetical protein
MAQWPHERSLVKNLEGKPFVLIGVHLNWGGGDAAKVKSVMQKQNLNWRSFVDDGAISNAWKPSGTPSFYIIDPAGIIRYKWSGAPAAKAIDGALEKVIEEAEGKAKKDAP